MASSPIIQQLMSIAGSQSEGEVRAFITEHWSEFPQDIQDHLAVAMMIDSVRAFESAGEADQSATPEA